MTRLMTEIFAKTLCLKKPFPAFHLRRVSPSSFFSPFQAALIATSPSTKVSSECIMHNLPGCSRNVCLFLFFSFLFLFSVCFKALLQSKKLHSFCLLTVNLSFQNIKPYFFVAENTAVALSCKLHLVSVEKYNHKILGKLPILPLVLCC